MKAKRYPTQEAALRQTRLVWTHIAEHGGTKRAAYQALGLPQDAYFCPCCQFTRGGEGATNCCLGCPLYPDAGSPRLGCEAPGEPFKAFTLTRSREERQAAARAMVELIDRRLAELPAERSRWRRLITAVRRSYRRLLRR